MEDKKVFGIIIGILTVIAIIVMIVFLKGNSKSIDIKLNENYKSVVGITVESDIILLVDDKNNISNILYLNEKSVKTFANQGLEGKNLDKGIELIVDKLKNNNEFNPSNELILTQYDYNDKSIYNNISTLLNKEFVIYGVDNKIVTVTSTLKEKITNLNISNSNDEIKSLYEYSKKLLKN